MAISGPTRALLILGLVLLMGAIIVLILMGKRRTVAHAEKVLATLCTQIGLSPIAVSASAIKYFHEYPSFDSPVRVAAGRVDGLHAETCFIPIVGRSRKGRTLVGVQCPARLGVEVGLSKRDAVSGITNSLFGQANGVVSHPLFGRYDGWGPPPDVARVFTPEIQKMTLAFPRNFNLVMVYGQDVVLLWEGIEEDVSMMKQAFRLAALLCETASKVID
jgi:hypothetical protein